MTDLELVTDVSRKIERILKDRFGANGKGMGQQVNSIEHKLPRCLVKSVRRVARVRNKVVHENAAIHSRSIFEEQCNEVLQDLDLMDRLINGYTEPIATGNIESIWWEYGIDDGSGIGMRIHSKLIVNNLREQSCRATAYFYFQSGDPLRDDNNQFTTVDGQVAAGIEFKPLYDSTVYNDLSFSIPYNEFHLSPGTYSLMFQIGLYAYSTRHQFAISDWQQFALTFFD